MSVEAQILSTSSAARSDGEVEAAFGLGTVSAKIYGREFEIGRLTEAYQDVLANGGTKVLLISGEAGCGKTSLVGPLSKQVNSGLGVFAGGRFERGDRVPYEALTLAIRELVGQQLRWCGEPELLQWRKTLKSGLSYNGRLMVDLVPEIEHLVEIPSPMGDLPPEEARRRLHIAFGTLLAAFASRKHPLVLFVDDLETLDVASLDFFRYLASRGDLDGVLLIGAYRAEELHECCALAEIIDFLAKCDAPPHSLELGNLSASDIRDLIRDFLEVDEIPDALCTQVFEGAVGNPFFTDRLLSELRDEGLLAIVGSTARWEGNIAPLTSGNVDRKAIDIVASKVFGLAEGVRKVLQLAACLRNSAALEQAAGAVGLEGVELRTACEHAIGLGLLRKRDDCYAFSSIAIRDLVYSTIPVDERGGLHLRLSQGLSGGPSVIALEEEVADQFNKAGIGPHDLKYADYGAELNLRAGRHAKECAAYRAAWDYFTQGLSALGRDAWSTAPELAFELSLEMARAEIVLANDSATEKLIEQLLPRVRTKGDRAAICQLQIELHVRRSETKAAVAIGLECLLEFGIVIPAHPTQAELEAVFIEVWHKLDAQPVTSAGDLPRMADPDIEAAMGILGTMYDPALFTDERLVGYHLCVMVSLTLDHGVTDASAHAFGFFGFAIAHYFGRYGDGYQFCELALDIVNRRGLAKYEGKVLLSQAMVSTWTHPMNFAIDASRTSFAVARRRGDVPYACYSSHHIVTERLLRGDDLEDVASELERLVRYVGSVGFERVLHVLISQQRFVRAMTNGMGENGIFGDEEFDEQVFERGFVPEETPLKVYWHFIIKAKALFIYGDFVGARDALERARPYAWASIGHIQLADHHFLMGLTVAESGIAETSTVRSEMTEHIEWLARWADSSPSSFASRHLLLMAELARIEERFGEAERLYERAIETARRHGLAPDEAVASEVAGRFYEARGAEQTALIYFRNSRDCYQRWGAIGKTRQLEARFKNRWEQKVKPDENTSAASDVDVAWSLSKTALSIAEELDLERLADKILRLASETIGSQRAFLVVAKPEGIWIEAHAEKSSEGVSTFVGERRAEVNELSEPLIRQVARTLESVDLGSGTEPHGLRGHLIDGSFPTPILCMPLVKQSRLIAILYLEGRFDDAAIVDRGIAAIQAIAPQAAISLDNARVVAGLQKEVRRLAESEQELRVASDAMPTLTWSSDSVGGSEQFNKQWYEYTGMTPEEARDGGWKYTFHPDDRAASAAAWHRAVTKKEVGEVELRLRGRDGDYRWFLVRASPFCDSTGQIIRVYGTESDIDDLKRAESLLAGEKRLFEMIATGHSLTSILDSLCATIGDLSGEALISIMLLDDSGETLRSQGGHNLPEGFAAAVDGIQVGPQSGSCGTAAFRKTAVMVDDISVDPLWQDFRGLARDFSLRACWSTPIMATNGSVLGTIAIYSRQSRRMTDRERQVVDQFTHLASIVIERRAAEAALRKSEALLADGQRISNTGSWAWSFHTGKIVWSDEHCRIFGYRLEDVGGTFEDMLARMRPEESLALREILRGPTSRKEDFHFEYTTTLPNGLVKQLSCTGRASLNYKGDLVEYVGTTMDITERKRVESQLIESASHLREVQAELARVARATTMGELAASIAHEVNQPLTGIIASGGAAFRWLSKDVPDIAKAKESLQNVIGDGRRASEVIARIRKMFRKELGSREPLEISEVIEDVVALTRVELQKNDVSLRVELPDSPPPIPGDRVQLQQVFVNLILNAIDGMKAVEKGSRTVTVSVMPEKDDHVRINVCDTGVGVAPDDAEKVFRPFYTSKPGGMGMGLSICRSIVENHGGQMRLARDYGPGCRFEVTLPTGDGWMKEA